MQFQDEPAIGLGIDDSDTEEEGGYELSPYLWNPDGIGKQCDGTSTGNGEDDALPAAPQREDDQFMVDKWCGGVMWVGAANDDAANGDDCRVQ